MAKYGYEFKKSKRQLKHAFQKHSSSVICTFAGTVFSSLRISFFICVNTEPQTSQTLSASVSS